MHHGGRDGDADRVQGGAGGLLLHGCQSNEPAVPGLYSHARGFQGRVHGHGHQVPLLRTSRPDAQRRLVADVRSQLFPGGMSNFTGHSPTDFTKLGQTFVQHHRSFKHVCMYSRGLLLEFVENFRMLRIGNVWCLSW